MRIQTVIFGCALLILSLVKYSDAVACSDTVTTECTDCTDAANAADPDCVTTLAPATEATTAATGEATTASSGSTATTASSGGSNGNAARRRLLRRIRYLQRRLVNCRRTAAYQRAYLNKKIQSLTASNNNSKNKFFG